MKLTPTAWTPQTAPSLASKKVIVPTFDPTVDYTNIVGHDTLCDGLVTGTFEQTAQGLSWCLRRAIQPGDFDLLEDVVEAFKTFPGSSPGGSTIGKLLLGTHSIGKTTPSYGKYAGSKLKAATLNRVGDEVYTALCRTKAYAFGKAHGPDSAFVQHNKDIAVFKQLASKIAKMSKHPALTTTAHKSPISNLTEADILHLLKTRAVTLPSSKENFDRVVPQYNKCRPRENPIPMPVKAQKLSATRVGNIKRVDFALEAEGFINPSTAFNFDSTKISENAWKYYPIARLQFDNTGKLVQTDAGWRHTVSGKLDTHFWPDEVLQKAIESTFPEFNNLAPEIA